ncbi:MAG: UvrD-helicase domain-containing protein, partial [Flavobacteriaceae bacterium]
QDLLPISDFNKLISKEIKNNPVPYIYERLGEKYRHYFIDEFQDTSQMQWENLVPLVSNALEGEVGGAMGSLLLVGDAKQAIYRWRGGRAEQFLDLITMTNNPFVINPKIERLPANFRSYDEIVHFNNAFFSATASHLGNGLYQKLFVEGNQQLSNEKKGGMVNLHFMDTASRADMQTAYTEQVLQCVLDIRSKGYPFGDMAILVRNNVHGILLAEFLAKHDVPVVSQEALLLQNNEEVRFLISLLKFMVRPNESEMAFGVLIHLADYTLQGHSFIQKNLDNLDGLLAREYGFDIHKLTQSSVYEILDKAMAQFQLAKKSSAYLIHLLDIVHEVELRFGTGLAVFLAYWEKKRETLAISAPEKVNAIHVMSIHKSKGLEFPIVIYPFANSKLKKENNTKLWFPVDPKEYHGFETLPINKKKEVSQYGDTGSLLFKEEEQKLELDAFNVLYVALTRAVKALFILSEKGSNTGQIVSYGDLFRFFLEQKGLWSNEQSQYVFGHLEKNGPSEKKESRFEYIEYSPQTPAQGRFDLIAKSGDLWEPQRENALQKGNLLHSLMEHIETAKDFSHSLDLLEQRNEVNEASRGFLERMVPQILAHPKLEAYYREGTICKNEVDILTKEGLVLRPDRLIFAPDGVTIIDYKTGNKSQQYQEQLHDYGLILAQMGFAVKDKIIVYVNDTVELEYV